MSGTPRMGTMGGSNFSLRSWVRERFVPVVMVLSSDEAETICREKNGLNLVDVLRPFGHLANINYPMRLGEQNIRLQEFRLRFHYAATIDQPTAEVLDTYLKMMVTSTVEEKLKTLPGSLEECQRSANEVDLSPWFSRYRDEFLRLLCFDAHETFDHPVGCMFMISSAEPDPLAALDKLKRGNPWPPLMSQEYMFPVQEEDFAKFIVVVHDGSKGGQGGLESARAKVASLQRSNGANCALLLINTSDGKAERRCSPPEPFESFRKPSVPGGGAGEVAKVPPMPEGGLGLWLSRGDLDRIRALVETFVSQCLLPKLDLRIGKMTSALPVKRRSFTKLMDRTSSYFKINFTGSTRDQATPAGFKYYTVEAQGRQMGDLLFLLQRYEDALEAYGAVSVTREQYPKFYAGLQEMIGLCHAMIVAFGNPPYFFARAFDYYQRVPGKTCRMLATRCGIVHATYCASVGQPGAANQVLMQGYESEEMLRGALLLEQAALTLLQCNPPVLRKFAFQMTLAGVWYYNCMFRGLSLRCYEMVLGLYKGRQWTSLEEHIGDMMLRFALEQGEFDSVVGWTQQMLSSNNHLSLDTQKRYLSSLSEYVKSLDAEAKARMLELDIPVVDTDKVFVEVDDHFVVGSNEAHEAGEQVWGDLEDSFKDPLGSSVTGMGSMSSLPPENHGLAVCGEDIRVLCQFQNPLKVAIKLDEVKLLYEYEWSEGATGANPVTVAQEKFTLRGEETLVIRLALAVNSPGRLKILGVSWTLNETIPGEKRFAPASHDTANRLPMNAKAHSPCLCYVVISPVPRLEAVSAEVPDDMWEGEVWDGSWELKNNSSVSLRNVQVAVSCRDAIFCKVATETPNGESSRKSVERHSSSGRTCYTLDSMNTIKGGASIFCPVWLHPSRPGERIVHCLFRYESVEPSGLILWRYLRYSFGLKIHSALKLKHGMRPASGPELAYLVSVQVENERIASEVQIESATSLTAGWGMSKASSSGPKCQSSQVQLDQRVPPKQRGQVHLLLTPPSTSGKEENGEATDTSDDDSGALDVLQQQRIKAATECSTSSGEDSLGVCVQWAVPGSETVANSSRRQRTRWGLLYFVQSVREVLKPIHLIGKGKFDVRHRFSESPVCMVPVDVIVRNATQHSASVRVESGSQFEDRSGGWHADLSSAGPPSPPAEESSLSAGVAPARSLIWCGQTRESIPVLDPGGVVSIPLSLAVLRPGLYRVSDYSCSWTVEDSPAVHGTTSGSPFLLKVSDEKE
ncbi:hypothetical protein BSKO_03909 [Bryopsis sp. KO-2023]|nr:hypothetical protein BSKO_03909 [Bryopsis sp. KO-2023]